MKLRKQPFTFAALLMVLFMASTYSVSAFSVDISKPSEDDLHIFGGEIVIEQKVHGDVLAFGGTVDIFGDVTGDVIVAGGKVSIHGNVGDDVRVAGGMVSVNGNVGDDVVAYGGTLDLKRGSTVGGSVAVQGSGLTIDGNVHEDVTGFAKMARIRGWVDGDVSLWTPGFLSFSSNARVKGNVQYFSKNIAVIPDGVVAGSVERTPISNVYGKGEFFVLGWAFLGLLLLGLLCTIFLPEFPKKVSTAMREHFWKYLGLGFVTWVVILAVGILALISVVGMLLGFMLFVGLFVAWIFAKIFAAQFIGDTIFRGAAATKSRSFGHMAAGLLLMFLISMIPVIGPVFIFLLVLLAFGSLIREKFKLIQFLKSKKYL